ncbi:ABC-transporter [Mollisia scopiformis]|uniref:ABC-transporter n=1 Tax=Mollisia scopiformis TaxID=149040 RepID=A0A132B944_MOLSC|nr:ABC-transporter [Mollisia scopiformis]KUJ08928.1 ABC-transporter [Mollisia scopiformis]
MLKQFKGEVVYNQEVDKHFPHLTVGETLEFAAKVRTPQQRLVEGISRESWAKHMSQVVMTIFGLSHTYNTKVGNDFVRGVSGGERKRVSIAEMALAGSPIAAWDNSTRGLDAATALEFTKSLRLSSNLGGTVHLVAIYQASQAIYDEFDKAVVLYEGRQIYFGPCEDAKQYFVDMGWECPTRQTTGDFLTSVTNPSERRVRKGYEKRVPRTAAEFETYWRESIQYKALKQEIKEHEEEFPMGGKTLEQFTASRKGMQANHVRPESPYTVSIPMQIKYCTQRAYQRLWNDRTSTVTTIVGQIGMALIIGSIFYGTRHDTASFFQKGGVLFFAVLLNALISIGEINTLYNQRPIVEKQASYAFYHPFAEAAASIVADIPVKFMIATCFNIILYFLAGLRREPSQFFIFFLFNFVAILTMSQIYRGIAASTKTVSQALAIAGVVTLAIVIYTGFVIPRPDMHPWFKWISWINPVAYAFEGLFVNELHGQRFDCSQLVPSGGNYALTGNQFICAVAGAVAGQTTVSGDDYLESQFQYSYAHIWRNLGFMFAFMIFFLFVYLGATEFNSATSSSAEVLVFRRGHVPKQLVVAEKAAKNDEESPIASGTNAGKDDAEQEKEQDEQVQALAPQTDVFTWKDVCYDIKIKGEPRRLLDNVSGWVKPGTLTALMGVSGAGKTTLLDVLAQRVSMGIVTGDMLVSGKPLDESFQRKTGYVQQQDLHLETTTVREALRFSAMLRQPKSVSKEEKFEFVEDVIKMLNMQDFAEAVVGVPGEGLNVEQRKLLTIGVELAAKPALLLFLDEPTSGLDSQSSWAIVAFLRKLADNGQAVLATIHQPSAILFQEFDRLLFLAKGGKTVYFGDIGHNSETLLNYFESNGADKCGENDNPAEYMLTMVGAGATGKSTKDWHDVWKNSNEAKEVQNELGRIKQEMGNKSSGDDATSHSEFAMPLSNQLYEVTLRVFQQYWRTPGYVYSKIVLGVASALFIGFSFFHIDSSSQGLQDAIFSIFMITTIFTTLVQQIMPRFILQRDLYEVRERPSKAYSWKAFLMANIIVEIPYQILLGIMVFASYYYPIYTSGGIPSSERQGLILLLIIQFFVFTSTFAHMLIAALPDAETAGNIGTLMFSLILTFNGVFQTPQALPGFWIFMYRVSPLTYLVSAIASTGLSGREITCASNELAIMQPPAGDTCGDYLQAYASLAGGRIYNPDALSNCQYCPESNADQFLTSVDISYSTRWRNYGIGFAYIFFNIFMAVMLYYLFRVRNGSGKGLAQRFSWVLAFFKKDPKKENKGPEKAKTPQDQGEKILP